MWDPSPVSSVRPLMGLLEDRHGTCCVGQGRECGVARSCRAGSRQRQTQAGLVQAFARHPKGGGGDARAKPVLIEFDRSPAGLGALCVPRCFRLALNERARCLRYRSRMARRKPETVRVCRMPNVLIIL